MRIPIYDSPQVQAQGIPGGLQQQTESQAAKALGYAGQAAQIFLQEKEKADQTVAEEKFNSVLEHSNKLTTFAETVRGGNVRDMGDGKPLSDSMLGNFNTFAAEQGKDLSDAQRRYYEKAVERQRLSLQGRFLDHEARQMEVYRDDILKNTLLKRTNEALFALREGDTPAGRDAFNNATEHAKFVLAQRAKEKGLDPEAEVSRYASSINTEVIDTFLDKGKTTEAQAWWMLHDKEITGNDRGKVEKRLEIKTASDLGKSVGLDNIAPFLGSENKKDGIPLTEIIQNVMQDARLEGNDKAMDHAIATVKELAANQRHDWEEGSHKRVADVIDVANHKGPWAAMNSSQMATLEVEDPIEYDRVKAHLKGRIDARNNEQAEKMTPDQLWDWKSKYGAILFDPDFINFSENKLKSMTVGMPQQLRGHLQDVWQELKTNGGKKFQMDKMQATKLLFDAGAIKSEQPKKEEAALVGEFIVAMEAMSSSENKVIKWNDKAVLEYGRRWATNTKIKNGNSFLGIPLGGGKEVPLFKVLEMVPEDYKAQAIAAGRRVGITPTPEEIARSWAETQTGVPAPAPAKNPAPAPVAQSTAASTAASETVPDKAKRILRSVKLLTR